ncbi:MAG: type II toxin-antitoxin system RelE/ParE family toxin [Candidatus Thermoplasmatota archaeon]
MSFEVKVHPEVLKFIKELDKKTQKRIKESLNLLRDEPFRSRPKADIKILKGTKGRQDLLRLRIGNFRVIYSVEEKIVWVTDIFRRGKGYRD